MPIAKDDVALITGAASGFGLSLSQRLVAEGGRVILADINGEGAVKLAETLNEEKGSEVAVAFKVDTTNVQEQMVAFEKGKEKFGRIDYVFANAGIAERPFLPPVFDPATASTRPIVPPNLLTLNIDLIGQLNTAALAFQYFERQDPHPEFGFRGKLVVTSSAFGLYPSHVMPMYCTSKAGMVMFTRSAGVFYKNKGITVNAICPNLASTGIAPEQFFANCDVLTPVEFVVDQMMSVLGASQTNGAAIGVNGDQAWEHPLDEHRLEENKAAADVVDLRLGKVFGYKAEDIVLRQGPGKV